MFHTTGALGVGVENEVTVSAIENAVHVFWLWHQVAILHSPYLQTEHTSFKKTESKKSVGGAFQATAGFQDSEVFQKAMKMALKCSLSVNSHLS